MRKSVVLGKEGCKAHSWPGNVLVARGKCRALTAGIEQSPDAENWLG